MQKVSIIVQAKRKKITDNFYIIIIRGYYNRKPVASISTGHKVLIEHWDQTKRCVINKAPNAALINGCIKMKVQDMEASLLKQQVCGHTINRQLIYKAVKGLNESTDFIEFSTKTIQEDYNKSSTRRSYLAELTKIQQYKSVIAFADIDYQFLQGYKRYMINELSNSDNTIWKAFKFMNTMLNKAIKTGGIIKENPFSQFKRGSYTQKVKQGLSISHCDSIEKLADNEVTLPVIRMVAYRFLLMAYSGMRFADAKSFDPNTHVVDDHIVMEYTKCNTNVNNKMHKRLQKIVNMIEQYPLTISNQKFNQYLKFIAMQCKIPFNLSSHVGRHTMGSLLAQMEIPQDQAAIILGHKDSKSTKIYYHQTISNIDKSIDKLNAL